MIKKISIFFLLIMAMTSCREDDPQVMNPNEQGRFDTWTEVFLSYWNGMNYSYAFWDIDPTDWDQVYREYKPKFDKLKMDNKADDDSAALYFEQISGKLIDHHYSFILYTYKNGYKEVWKYFQPGAEEVRSRSYNHEEFSNQDMVNTISKNRALGRVKEMKYFSDSREDFFACSYLLDNDIAYFRLSQFALTGYGNQPRLQAVIQNFHSLVENTPGLKGIIIDTRNNGGGYVSDLGLFFTQLLKEKVLFGYTRSKNGLNRYDYSPWSPLELAPAADSLRVKRDVSNIPIVALADIHSVSMAEITPMAIKALPNGVLIGERTWGGHGPLLGAYEPLYSGKFENSRMQVYTSTSVTKQLDGRILEGIGLTPDIEVLFNPTEFARGNDTQLNRAAEFIHSGR